MLVRIKKSEGLREYEVPVVSDAMTVMDVLDYIYSNLDHSLAYYRHSACNQGICARCAVKLDGKTVLACATRVPSGATSILLEPGASHVARDLVTSRP